ncbi:MAG: acyl carrier protein [bacterium]
MTDRDGVTPPGAQAPTVRLGGQTLDLGQPAEVAAAEVAAAVAAFNAARRTPRPDLPDALNTEVLSVAEVAAFLAVLPGVDAATLAAMAGEQALELSARGLRLFAADGRGVAGFATPPTLALGPAGWRVEPGIHPPDLAADLEAAFALRAERQVSFASTLDDPSADEAAVRAAHAGVAVVERAALGIVRLAGYALKNGELPDEEPLTAARVAGLEAELSHALRTAPGTGRGWTPRPAPTPPPPALVAELSALVRETLALAPAEPLDPRLPLHGALGLTSMDLLDLIFRVEEHAGIVIPRGTAAALVRGPVAASAFAQDGVLTPLGRGRLAAFIGLPADDLPAEIDEASLPQHFTIEALARLVEHVRGRT